MARGRSDIKTFGKRIMSKAKELKKEHPTMMWRTAVSKAAKEIKKSK